MIKKFVLILAVLFLFSGILSGYASAKEYDRAGLENYINMYMKAMLNNDPSLDLFARDCKFTENGVRLPLGGEGLWVAMSGIGSYKFYVPDIEAQQVAFIGTAKEGPQNTLVAVAIRLKIVNDKITEAEQLVIRPDSSYTGGEQGMAFPPTGESVEKLGKPHKVYFETIPEDKRPSREEMIVTANYYFTGMQNNDGKGYYPFSDDCHRLENGMSSTNVPLKEGETMPDPKTSKTYSASWGCKQQFESGLLNMVTRIRDRRFVAVDRERGIVFAFGFFDHHNMNWTWQLAELFKIEDGLIRRIEAVFHRSAFGLNSGWSTYEQGISDEMQIVR